MAEKNFAITPSVSISRSKFLRTSTHKTSFDLGEIVPVYIDEVLPGDTRSIDLGALVRMSTPIAPIMDDIELELFAFFVPNRIVWKNWKKFMGEAAAAGFDSEAPVAPYQNIAVDDPVILGAYMGIGYNPNAEEFKVSALPLRGYISIYNRWFRDQNVEAPIYVDDGDGEDGSNYGYADYLLKAYKKSDYFTRALPYAQKGEPVKLPLGTLAPLKAVGKTADDLYDFADESNNPALFGGVNGAALTGDRTLFLDDTIMSAGSSGSITTGAKIASTNIYADLSKATAATINQLREAFQLQKLLEHDALYGTRYWEILYGHFGVRSPDASLQDPEYLGGFRMNINVDQVLQTSETSTTALGTPGANSVTGGKGSLFTKSFVEHGFIHIYAVARQKKHTYGQGLNRMWTRFDRYSYYWPEFANLGAQEIKNRELFVQGTSIDDKVFGYQEAWAEYRYKPSQVSGILNPAVSGSLGFWTLADNYASLPTLSTSFLKESRDNIMRALVTGDSGPDFIADFYFQDTAVRPMPMYSIPGLIDHH